MSTDPSSTTNPMGDDASAPPAYDDSERQEPVPPAASSSSLPLTSEQLEVPKPSESRRSSDQKSTGGKSTDAKGVPRDVLIRMYPSSGQKFVLLSGLPVVGQVSVVLETCTLKRLRKVISLVDRLEWNGEVLDEFSFVVPKGEATIPFSRTQEERLHVSEYLERITSTPQSTATADPTVYIMLPAPAPKTPQAGTSSSTIYEQTSHSSEFIKSDGKAENGEQFSAAINRVLQSVQQFPGAEAFLLNAMERGSQGAARRVNREVDPPLCPAPRKVPLTATILLLFVRGMTYEIMAFVCCLMGCIQGSVWCVEPAIFIPLFVFGILRPLKGIRPLRLLSRGSAVIPHQVKSEYGILMFGKCVEASGTISSSSPYPSGGWEVSYYPHRESLKVTTLEAEGVMDPRTNKPAQFMFAPTPWMGSVVIYRPDRPWDYMHTHEIPFGLRPNPATGEWEFPKRRMCGIVFSMIWAFVNFAVLVVGLFGVVGMIVLPEHYIFTKRGTPQCHTNFREVDN
ncbi:hypothetical protein HDU97_005285 [Phlyctochytrium planicorne]|nr:hypothetical protein HDU97_005285 [Phlyctochytrium planicorne]